MQKGFLTAFVLLAVANGFTLSAHGLWEQEWSENFAQDTGVRCTVPEMIDGDISTVGRPIVHKETNAVFPYAEVEITLPEKRAIHRMVIHNRGLETFKVLASTGEGDNWQIVERVRKNTKEEVAIRMSVVSDKLKIRIDADSILYRHQEFSAPEIGEIELYRLVDVSSKSDSGEFARDRKAEAQTGIGTWFSRNDDDPIGISFKGWAGENGGELRVAAFGIFSELTSFDYEESAFGLVSDYRILYRYSSRAHEIPYVDDTFLDNRVLIGNLFYPYLSLGFKGGFITGKAYSESITIWIYSIEAMGGFATNLSPFEVSLDLLGFGYIGLSIEDMGRASGFYRVRPSISIHYYF